MPVQDSPTLEAWKIVTSTTIDENRIRETLQKYPNLVAVASRNRALSDKFFIELYNHQTLSYPNLYHIVDERRDVGKELVNQLLETNPPYYLYALLKRKGLV